MKKFLKLATGMLLCIPVVSSAQQHYVLEGTINKLSAPAKIYLRHYKDKVVTMDSAILKNGFYHFEGVYEPDEQTYVGISVTGKGWHTLRKSIEIYLEPGRMKVNSIDSG